MDEAAVTELKTPFWRCWNWWKIGFFVVLVLFEGAREVAVTEVYEPPKFAVSNYVGRTGTLVSATGSWERIDNGSPLIPNAVRITCWENESKCYEITYNILDGYAATPDMTSFDAKFADDAVTYQNEVPDCATYSVRIDLALKKVLATRQKKDNVTDENCSKLEPRIEMALGDSFKPYLPAKDHFLPMLWLLMVAFGENK